MGQEVYFCDSGSSELENRAGSRSQPPRADKHKHSGALAQPKHYIFVEQWHVRPSGWLLVETCLGCYPHPVHLVHRAQGSSVGSNRKRQTGHSTGHGSGTPWLSWKIWTRAYHMPWSSLESDWPYGMTRSSRSGAPLRIAAPTGSLPCQVRSFHRLSKCPSPPFESSAQTVQTITSKQYCGDN